MECLVTGTAPCHFSVGKGQLRGAPCPCWTSKCQAANLPLDTALPAVTMSDPGDRHLWRTLGAQTMFCIPYDNPFHWCKDSTTWCFCGWVGAHSWSKWPLVIIRIEKNVSGSPQLSLLVSPKAKFSLCVSHGISSQSRGIRQHELSQAVVAILQVGLLKVTTVWFLRGVRALHNEKGLMKPNKDKGLHKITSLLYRHSKLQASFPFLPNPSWKQCSMFLTTYLCCI